MPVSDVESRRRQAVANQLDLIRVTTGPVGLPAADTTIDIDCEHKDGAVYLWGATLTTVNDRPEDNIPFSDWDPALDAAAEMELAGRFVDWLDEQVRRAENGGQIVAIYHYSATEPANLQRAESGHPRVASLTNRMVDLLAVVRHHFDGVGGKSLKTVAKKFGATWHSPDATGADTLDWAATARSDGPSATEARERLLRYNEDDTRALATVRAALVDN